MSTFKAACWALGALAICSLFALDVAVRTALVRTLTPRTQRRPGVTAGELPETARPPLALP